MEHLTTQRPPDEERQAPRLLRFKDTEDLLQISRAALHRAIKRGDLVVIQAPGTVGDHGKRVVYQSILDYIRDQMPSSALRKSSA